MAATTYWAVYASGATGIAWTRGGGWSPAPVESGSGAGPTSGAGTWSGTLTTGEAASTSYQVAFVWDDGANTSAVAVGSWATISAAISGSAAITQQPNAAAASGAVIVAGSAAVGQQLNTASANGGVAVAGSAAPTQQPSITTASGTVAISGSAAVTQQLNLATASGIVASGVTGSASITQAPNTSAASGTVAVSGSAAATQQPNTTSASGLVLGIITGSAALMQRPNVVTSSDAIIVPTMDLAGRTTEGVGGGGGGGGHHGTLGGLIQFDTKRSPSKDKKSPTAKALSADNSMRAQIERSNADILHIVMVATHTGALDG